MTLYFSVGTGPFQLSPGRYFLSNVQHFMFDNGTLSVAIISVGRRTSKPKVIDGVFNVSNFVMPREADNYEQCPL